MFPLYVSFSDHDPAPHLLSNVIIVSLCFLGQLLKPLCALSAASCCLWRVLYQPLGQVSEVDHLRLQGPEILLLTSQSLKAFRTACLNEVNMNSYNNDVILLMQLLRNDESDNEEYSWYLWSQSLLDFNLVLGGFQPPLCSLSALFKLFQATSQLLQLGGAVMKSLTQFVHPAVQLGFFISYLQKLFTLHSLVFLFCLISDYH